ncbi:hypothetical protein ACHAWF_005179 [Thalassiosira exigua]
MLVAATYNCRVATTIVMLLAAFPSRRCAVAFHHALRPRATWQHCSGGGATSIMAKGSRATARFMSYSEDDYNSMKVSELRDILKENGLAISGIKAQLVERLTTADHIVVKRVHETPSAEETIEHNGEGKELLDGPEYEDPPKGALNTRSKEDAACDDDEDLVGFLHQLKTMDSRGSGGKDKMESRVKSGRQRKRIEDVPVGKKSSRKTKSPDGQPRNLVFAGEGEVDDDEWDEADDDEFEGYDSEVNYNKSDSKDEEFDPNQTAGVPQSEPQQRRAKRENRRSNVTFRDDFQGTRVFVQGLPKEATWKELKDHFQMAGEVVYASVSLDKTGQSKQCGIVQFETPDVAQKAIREMRRYPMNGATLYVREDVQESRETNSRGGRGGRTNDNWAEDDPPTEWKRANDKHEDGNEEDWYNLTDEELKEIEGLIEKRDKQRMQRNYRMSDRLRDELKDEFGVHLDDRLKLWWTDTKHGGVPGMVSDLKGEGKWGKQKPWRQIPTNPESDAMVDPDLVMDLLLKRDKARRRKDFTAADALLQRAHDSPRGGLGLRIHDESRTWRIWTERPPPRRHETPDGYEQLTPKEMCLQIVTENEPDKVDEIRSLLKKFPGREWNIMKKLKERYKQNHT